jgi:GT2 family glycosyltransferase
MPPETACSKLDAAPAPVSGSKEPALSVILVSYNTRGMTLRCLHRLFDGLADLDCEVWVVDNASRDGSAEAIAGEFPQVRLVRSDRNLGFGAANNLAMRQARGRYYLLLNTDAFPEEQAIRRLMDFLENHPDTAVAGPRLLNGDGSLQVSCYRFPSPSRAWFENLWLSALLPHHPAIGDYRRWAHDRERAVDFVTGACMLVRREVVEQVGGFDERFFMYSEETDWQRRMRDAGWEIRFTPNAVVTHLGGASGAAERPAVNAYFFDSLDWYERKHHGSLGLLSLRVAMAVGCSIRAVLWGIAALLPSRRRNLARQKLALCMWLVRRQVTQWR